MYDEPPKLEGKKKKKRVRARKAPASEYDALIDLEEAPSSSKCMASLSRSSTMHEKAALKGKQLKYWRAYNEAKLLKVLARDTLIAALADGGMLDESEEGGEISMPIRMPEPLKTRHEKGGTRKAMMRRKARFAAAAAKCYAADMSEEEMVEEVPVEVRTVPSPQPKKGKAAQGKAAEEGWVRLAKAMAETESEVERESEASSNELELPFSKATSSPDGKQRKAKRDSKNCIVS